MKKIFRLALALYCLVLPDGRIAAAQPAAQKPILKRTQPTPDDTLERKRKNTSFSDKHDVREFEVEKGERENVSASNKAKTRRKRVEPFLRLLDMDEKDIDVPLWITHWKENYLEEMKKFVNFMIFCLVRAQLAEETLLKESLEAQMEDLTRRNFFNAKNLKMSVQHYFDSFDYYQPPAEPSADNLICNEKLDPFDLSDDTDLDSHLRKTL